MGDNLNEENEWGIPEEKYESKQGQYDFDKTANMPTKEITVDIDELELTEKTVNVNEPTPDLSEQIIAETVSGVAEETVEEVTEETSVAGMVIDPAPEHLDAQESHSKPGPSNTPDNGDDGNGDGFMSPEEEEKEAKEKKAFIISVIAALVLIVLVGAYILFKVFGSGSNNQDVSEITESVSSDANNGGAPDQSPDTLEKEKELTPEKICAIEGHDYEEATCTTARVCKRCGYIDGKPLGHDFSEPTCTEPATCSRCGATGTEALGHDYGNASCTEAAVCSRCGESTGEPLGHDYSEATCTEPATCSRCGETTGEPLGHDYSVATCTTPATCSRCGATQGTTADHNYVQTSETTTGTTKTIVYTCSVCGATKTETVSVPASSDSDYVNQVIDLVNADRAANGLGPVTATAELNQAAAQRAKEIYTLFDHSRPDGTSCFTVLSQYGVSYSSAGENIAAGQSTPSAVETAWMNSPGHRANILTAGFTHIGVGYYETSDGYRYYWVQLFTN